MHNNDLVLFCRLKYVKEIKQIGSFHGLLMDYSWINHGSLMDLAIHYPCF
jgi:hypothetical protein